MKQPFFTEALPCESCGAPVSSRTWNAEHEIWIGSDCCCNAPDLPIPACLIAVYEASRTVGELLDSARAHRLTCPVCGPVELPVKAPAEIEEEAA
jgi:hypothetical protein